MNANSYIYIIYLKRRIVKGWKINMDFMPSTYCNWNYGNGMNVRTDYGKNPFVINIRGVTMGNHTFRTVLWTGEHLQLTVMSLHPGEDIGLEMHPNVDQFLRIEQGQGIVQMGNGKDNLNMQWIVFGDSAIIIPAGTWHNLINIGNVPLKLYSIYAPPNQPYGTVHPTKQDANKHEH